jgi:hypothetical protein
MIRSRSSNRPIKWLFSAADPCSSIITSHPLSASATSLVNRPNSPPSISQDTRAIRRSGLPQTPSPDPKRSSAPPSHSKSADHCRWYRTRYGLPGHPRPSHGEVSFRLTDIHRQLRPPRGLFQIPVELPLVSTQKIGRRVMRQHCSARSPSCAQPVQSLAAIYRRSNRIRPAQAEHRSSSTRSRSI